MTVKLYDVRNDTRFIIPAIPTYERQCCCSIIPPHISSKISSAQLDDSLKNLSSHNEEVSNRIRANRLSAVPTPSTKSKVKIYDAQHSKSLNRLKKKDPTKTSDVDVKNAWKYGNATLDFFKNALNRNSIDDRGMDLKMIVNYRKGYGNAFWDGKQMVFGDGDPRGPNQVFTTFTADADITGHEIGHGATQYAVSGGGLVYQGESGALNESISDVIGIQVKMYMSKIVSEDSNWQIGEYVLVDKGGRPYALRNMLNPGTGYVNHPLLGDDPQPGHMAGYINTTEDNGGVHYNSGIPNRAFALTCLELGGHAWEIAGKVWYATYPLLKPTDGFKAMAEKTIQVAIDKFGGVDSAAHRACVKGWRSVGVLL